MIVGTGVDLAEVPRIRASIERYGEKFIRRIYTPAEIAYVERKANKYERYAARFAAKEAGMKAIGTGWRRGDATPRGVIRSFGHTGVVGAAGWRRGAGAVGISGEGLRGAAGGRSAHRRHR